jgi:hypothetical protein
MPPGYQFIRGNVVDLAERVARKVDRGVRCVKRSRKWHKMT